MTVKVFKLINGEEIISEIFNYHHQTVELKKPAKIVVQQTAQGMGVGLDPYMPYVDGTVHLHRTVIASEGDPVEQMKNEYSRSLNKEDLDEEPDWAKLAAQSEGFLHGSEGSDGASMDRAKKQWGPHFKHYKSGFLKGRDQKCKTLKALGQ